MLEIIVGIPGNKRLWEISFFPLLFLFCPLEGFHCDIFRGNEEKWLGGGKAENINI